jgi:septum formation protein
VRVKFRRLRDDEIEAYIATGEPMDKAGAYGIQGYGATIVERIEGDYFAVMGLPIVRLIGLLRDVGVRYRFGSISTTLAD